MTSLPKPYSPDHLLTYTLIPAFIITLILTLILTLMLLQSAEYYMQLLLSSYYPNPNLPLHTYLHTIRFLSLMLTHLTSHTQPHAVNFSLTFLNITTHTNPHLYKSTLTQHYANCVLHLHSHNYSHNYPHTLTYTLITSLHLPSHT